MSESTTRICARPGCGERFSLVLRAGRDSGRAKAGRKRSLHKGRRYCSDTCRKLAAKARHWSQSSPEMSSKRSERAATFSTVTSASNTVDISRGYKGRKSGRAGLQITFGDYAVVLDPDWPKMYRVRHPDGWLSDMVNLSRARDAAKGLAVSD